ncbi:MAG: sensor histidine kinase [Clostridium sp.]
MKNRFKLLNKMINKFQNTKLYALMNKGLRFLKNKFDKSIRFELMVIVGLCFISSFAFYGVANGILRRTEVVNNIEYDYEYIQYNGNRINEQLNAEISMQVDREAYFKKVLEQEVKSDAKAYITDLDGNVIYKTANAIEKSIDIFTVMKNNTDKYEKTGAPQEVMYIYPLKVEEDRYYFIYSEIPRAELKRVEYIVENSFLALFLSVVVFITIFLIITNKKMIYLDQIALGLNIIAEGQLNHKIEEKGNDEISNLAININNMASEINSRIKAERMAEKTKSDLITNVSHDLRTPLTSIMGYIGLIKERRYKDENEMNQYLDIAFNKAEKLKILIDDLFEYTKLNNNGIKISKVNVNIVEFIAQLIDELTPLFEENDLEVMSTLRDEKILVNVDINKMLRVFENLLTNAIKYSYKPGTVIVGLYENNGSVTISIKNKGNHIEEAKLDKLFDRFYRVDESRNAESGGSGLGLAISKNIVELHGGKIWAECYGNDINFYVRLKVEKK